MSFKDSAIAKLLRPRVLHTLPGRLRIHFPLLERLPAVKGDDLDFAARLLSVPEGIDVVKPCRVTGNVLIQYDPERLSAEEVLRYLRSATQLCVTNRSRLEQLTAEGLHEKEERLCAWLKSKLSYRLELDGAARIPDDILV